MKKVILSLIVVFVFGTSFANNNNNNNIEKPLRKIEASVNLNKKIDIQDIQPSTFFTRCKITHNVTDEEGNTMGTVVYSIQISEGTCKEASASLRNLSRELVGAML